MIRRLAVLLFAMTIASPARAGDIDPLPFPIHPEDGNLVTNPYFDTYAGLDGWSPAEDVPPDSIELCPTCDVDEQAGSNGVILLVNDVGWGDLTTCVPVRSGAEYDIGVWVQLPQIGPYGFAGVHLDYMADHGCGTLVQDHGSYGVFSTTPGAVQGIRSNSIFVIPAGVTAIALSLRVQKLESEDAGYFKASFDEPFVVPEPGGAALLASLAALSSLRIRRAPRRSPRSPHLASACW